MTELRVNMLKDKLILEDTETKEKMIYPRKIYRKKRRRNKA